MIAFAASEEGSTSHTLFYVLGGLAAAYGVVIAAIGITKPDFPASGGAARAVFALSTLVVLGAMAGAVIAS